MTPSPKTKRLKDHSAIIVVTDLETKRFWVKLGAILKIKQVHVPGFTNCDARRSWFQDERTFKTCNEAELFWIKGHNADDDVYLGLTGFVVEWCLRRGIVLFDNSEAKKSDRDRFGVMPPVPPTIMREVCLMGLPDHDCMSMLKQSAECAYDNGGDLGAAYKALSYYVEHALLPRKNAKAGLYESDNFPVLFGPSQSAMMIIRYSGGRKTRNFLYFYYQLLCREHFVSIDVECITNENGFENWCGLASAQQAAYVCLPLSPDQLKASPLKIHINKQSCWKWFTSRRGMILFAPMDAELMWDQSLQPHERRQIREIRFKGLEKYVKNIDEFETLRCGQKITQSTMTSEQKKLTRIAFKAIYSFVLNGPNDVLDQHMQMG